MATRLAEPEPWTRVAAVLAEAAGTDESRSFDDQALARAKTMRGVRHDWAGKPTITWTMAAELLASLRAEQARVAAAIEERVIEADRAFRASLPAGIPAGAVPEGVSAGLLMMLSDEDAQRARRQSVVEHSLEHPAGAIVYTPIGGDS
jgi:hypothetical protein